MARTKNTKRKSIQSLALVCGCLLASVLDTGCTGHGTVHTVPFMRSDFGPAEHPIISTPVTEAYYWVEPDGQLRIALRHHAPSLLGKVLESDWQMSMVLDGLPAGVEKLYTLNSRSVRVKHSRGPAHQRFASLAGVAVAGSPKHRTITGRFHATVRGQQFGVFSGWSPALQRGPLVVMVGTFTAVENADRGRAILQHTEDDGFDRKGELPPTLRGTPTPATRAAGTQPGATRPSAPRVR